jgi:hypothetical protein
MPIEDGKVDWKKHVLAWRQSGLSQRAYSERHGLRAKTLSARHVEAMKGKAKAVPLTLVAATLQSEDNVIKLRHRSGWEIDWPSADRASLLKFARQL